MFIKTLLTVILASTGLAAMAQSVTTSEGPKQFGAVNTSACISSAPAVAAMAIRAQPASGIQRTYATGSNGLQFGGSCPAGTTQQNTSFSNTYGGHIIFERCVTGSPVRAVADVAQNLPVCMIRNTQDAYSVSVYPPQGSVWATMGGPELPHYQVLFNENNLCNLAAYSAPKFSEGCRQGNRGSYPVCRGSLTQMTSVGVCPAGTSWRNSADVPGWVYLSGAPQTHKNEQYGAYWGCFRD